MNSTAARMRSLRQRPGQHAREHRISARLYRQRRENGKAYLRLEVDLGELEDMLVAAGFMKAWDTENRAAVEAATQKFLAFMMPIKLAPAQHIDIAEPNVSALSVVVA